MSADSKLASVAATASGRPSSTSSGTDSANGAQTTQFTGPPGGAQYGGGPPAWIETAVEQYQQSLHGNNATSSSTTLMTSATSTSSTTSPAAVSQPPSSASKPSGNDKVKIGVSIAFGVSFLWLISAFVIWWILRKRRAKARKSKETQSVGESSSGYSTSHPCACQCHEVEGTPGIKREELDGLHRAEMKGSSAPSRTELPA
ncbi:MAG: hypothetical protein Q9168_007670 [Polycauliona sp. 1 TL-2023]